MPWIICEKKLKIAAYCVNKLGKGIDVCSVLDNVTTGKRLLESYYIFHEMTYCCAAFNQV